MSNNNQHIHTEGIKEFLVYLSNNNASLTDNEVNDFFNLGTPVKLSKGEVFLGYGEVVDKIAFIQTGLLEMTLNVNESDKIIDFLYPQAFATDAICYSLVKPSESQIRASLDSEIVVYRKEEIMEVFKINAKYQRIDQLIIEKSYLELIERIRWMYLSPKERYEIFLKKYPAIVQQIPQYKIASFLNVTPEWLSKIRSLK